MFVMRRFAGPMMAKVKETTGLVGLEVVPNAREVLIKLYNRTLKEVQCIPEDVGYRKAVERFTRHRLKICEEEEDWEAIENRVGCGQVEELIEDAEDELTLIPKMAEWKPWIVPDDYVCEIIINDVPVPRHVPRHVGRPLSEDVAYLKEKKFESGFVNAKGEFSKTRPNVGGTASHAETSKASPEQTNKASPEQTNKA